MKIKIIDLLNLVYEKKAPKKILYKYCEYEFNYVANDYVNKDGLALFSYLFKNEEQALYKEVEIIEERPKEIEEMSIKVDEFEDSYYDTALIALSSKVEEIRKVTNYLLKKEE